MDLLTNLPVPYGIPISHLAGGAFSVIVKSLRTFVRSSSHYPSPDLAGPGLSENKVWVLGTVAMFPRGTLCPPARLTLKLGQFDE